ncbi:MAG: hypothetical protein JWO85_236 [Candidatus Eremiobacteraeota bacterium]|jgi:hypothetical protein|nr:hypothetical protein [Candidatus Eremiobacteraeota bacterium]
MGAYLFSRKKIDFDIAMTTCCMFYGSRLLGKRAATIKERINTFFGEALLIYKRF